MIEIKVVTNVILNKIYFHDQPFRMHRSPPRSRQNLPDSKNSKIDKSHTDISDLIIECYVAVIPDWNFSNDQAKKRLIAGASRQHDWPN